MTTRFADHLPTGDHASLPDPATVPVGAIYSCTTHGLIYKNDGASWPVWATLVPAGGAVGQALVKVDSLDYRIAWGDVSGGGGGGGGSRFDSATDPLWAGDNSLDLEFDIDDSTGTLPPGWSWVNQGTASFAQKWGAGVLTPRSGGTSENHCMIVRSLPTADAWKATVKIGSTLANLGQWHRTGLVLRDSTTGKYTILSKAQNAVQLNDWSSLSVFAGTETAYTPYNSPPVYLRVERNAGGASHNWRWSVDGVSWFTHAASRAKYATYDQIGLLACSPDTTPDPVAFHWFRVR